MTGANANNLAQPLPPGAAVLIVLTGSLGDVTRGLALLSALKLQRPDLRVSWLVDSRYTAVLQGNPMLERVFVFERHGGLSAVGSLRRTLRETHFDLSLDLQRHFKSGFFSRLSGARRRIGFHPRNSKELNWLFNNEHIDFYPDTLPKILHYLKFLDRIGLDSAQRPLFDVSYIKPSPAAAALIARLKQPCTALVLGSAWKSKDWPEPRYHELAGRLLASSDSSILLLGDAASRGMAARIVEQAASSRVHNCAGTFGVAELFPLLGAVTAAVGPDSGPGHIAAAVGTPYVSLFGPTSPVRTAPFGYEHLVVEARAECRPCYRRRCPGLGEICMQRITVEMVLEKLMPLLKNPVIAGS